MGKLVLFRADGTAKHIKLDRERITIGRRPDNDVCLPQPAVSGEHAAVVTILADSFLEDLGSTNGTLVNGTPVTKHFLRDRDEIDVGRQILVYLADDSAPLDAPPAHADGSHAPDDRPASGVGAPTASSAAPGAPRDKRRTDVPTSSRPSPADGPRANVAAEVAGGTADAHSATPDAPGADEAAAVDRSVGREPAVEVLSGALAGRRMALTKRETLIGRAGVQVAALRRDAGEFVLVPVEGSTPPRVNGMPVAPEGRRLAGGDIMEIAGTKIGVVIPAGRSDGDS